MKKAFTMLELVFVIIVVGIISATLIQNTQRNSTREAAEQIVSHLRYTQHLALSDDKFDRADPNWYKKRWEFLFGKSNDTNGKIAYSIFADDAGAANAANPNKDELAKDPQDQNKYLSGGYSGTLKTSDADANKKLNIGETYGITSVVMTGGCVGSCIEGGANCNGDIRFSFDHMGRPILGLLINYVRPYENGKLLTQTCTITLTDNNGDSTAIFMEPETGYVHIN